MRVLVFDIGRAEAQAKAGFLSYGMSDQFGSGLLRKEQFSHAELRQHKMGLAWV